METDPRNLYDFTQASHSGEPGFDPYQNETNEKFYFLFNDNSGKVFLFSQPFESLEKRDGSIREVIKNAGKRQNYQQEEGKEGFYFILRGAEGKELARSRSFEKEEEMREFLDYLQKNAPAYSAQYPEPLSSKESVNNYDFSQPSVSGQPGFDTFRSSRDRLYYFHFNDKEGNPILFSEGYSSPRARQNGIRSVSENGVVEANYQIESSEGVYFLKLKAKNHQEIARSHSFPTEDDARALLGYLLKELPEHLGRSEEKQPLMTSDMKGSKSKASSKSSIRDEYDMSFQSKSGKKGFETFQREDNKEYYFHFNDEGGKALFFSEGYKGDKSRDNGIRSVIKNSVKENHFTSKRDEEGHYFSLRAGNYQEIGRSRYFDTEKELATARDWFMKTTHRSAEEFGVEVDVPKALLLDPLARKFGKMGGGDDYDLEQPGKSTEPGFDSFRGENNGQHYFHYNGEDGQPLFYSEGYQNDKSRDNGIRSVIKNSIVEEHFSTKEDQNGKYFTLRAGNYQEIGRSKYFDSEEELAGAMAWFMKNVHTSADDHGIELDVPAHLLAVPLAKGALGTSSDDYDMDQNGSSSDPGFDSFRGENNGQHYFHYNGEDGQPLFYSEGYQNDKSRDKGIRSVIKNSLVEEHFSAQEDENGKYFTLRAGNYQEIGRSKYFDSEEGLAGAMMWFMQNVHKSAEAFGVMGLTIPSHLREDSKVPDSPPVLGAVSEGDSPSGSESDSPISHKSTYESPSETTSNESGVEAAPSTGDTEGRDEEKGRPWWLWLLLALILLIILLFLLRGCEGSPFYAGGTNANKELVAKASGIALGKMGTVQGAFEAGYFGQGTYEALATGKLGRADVDWAGVLDGGKLVEGGLLKTRQWTEIRSGNLDWDWMQMRPASEVFGGLGGLLAAKNDTYLDLKTYDSLRLGDLELEKMKLETKLTAVNLDALVAGGVLTEENKGLLNVGEAGWEAIMSAPTGKTALQLGAWGNLDNLLKLGIISQEVYDSLMRAGDIDLDKFDWENHLDLGAAAKAGLITPTLKDKLDRGEVAMDWPNMKEIPVLQSTAENTEGGTDPEIRKAELTPIPSFGPFEFAKNSYKIRAGDEANFEKLISYLEKNSSFTLEITGHTDPDGTEAYNMSLGKQRAETVKALLSAKGVSSSRISTRSAGESAPKASNDSESGKAKNRRVEIMIQRN